MPLWCYFVIWLSNFIHSFEQYWGYLFHMVYLGRQFSSECERQYKHLIRQGMFLFCCSILFIFQVERANTSINIHPKGFSLKPDPQWILIKRTVCWCLKPFWRHFMPYKHDLGCHLGSNQSISDTRSTSQHHQPKISTFEKLDFELILALSESLSQYK